MIRLGKESWPYDSYKKALEDLYNLKLDKSRIRINERKKQQPRTSKLKP